MNKFVCLFSVLMALPAVVPAQEASPSTAPQASVSPVVLAEISGYQLTDRDLDLLLQMIPSISKQTMTPEQRQQIIKNWMQVVIFSKEAQAEGWDRDPAMTEQIEMFRKRLLFERYQKELLSQVKVSPEETRRFFEDNKSQFQTPGEARVSRILVPTREKADEIRRQLAEGVPFEQLAKEQSTDGISREQGGDIGWVRPDHKEADLVRVVQTLEPNQISEPFLSPVGWQIVKVTDKRNAVQKGYAEVEKMISQQLLLKKQREILETKVSDLSKKYELKIYEAPK